MKVRITLEAIKAFGTTNIGDPLILINEIFDPKNGIAFFNIERDKWKVLNYQQYSTINDKNKKEIYVGDYLKADTYNGGKFACKVFGAVVFDEGSFCIEIFEMKGYSGYDIGQKIPLFDFTNIEIQKI